MSRPPEEILGVLLAGGESRRYGSPKWRARVGGRSLGERALEALRPPTSAVVLSGDEEAADELGLELLPDLHPGSGPLAGLHAGLREASRRGCSHLALLACDLPFVGSDEIGALLEKVPPHGGAILADQDGGQPAAGAYSIAVLDEVERALAAGSFSFRDVAAAVGAVEVDVATLRSSPGLPVLLNVNRPLDRIRADTIATPGPPLICVVGKKNSGKTAMTVALAAELTRRGLRVMTVKHGHGFDLDTPGTDSWRHREEGRAERVMLVGPDSIAMTGRWGEEGERPLRELVDRYLDDAELVVAEGWKVGPDAKIDVYRRAAHEDPVFEHGGPDADTFLATVTDVANYQAPHPVFHLAEPDHVERLAELLIETLLF